MMTDWMKKLYSVVFCWFALFTCGLLGCVSEGTGQSSDTEASNGSEVTSSLEESNYTSDEEMQELYNSEVSGEQVLIKARVIKKLPDDNEGSRHQKFIVELESGQTVLVSHNIDLAARIDDLNEGDMLEIFGQYEWNDRGGVIHWTHPDPDGEHIDGWIRR